MSESEQSTPSQIQHEDILQRMFAEQGRIVKKIDDTPAPLEHDTLNDLRLEERGDDAKDLETINDMIAKILHPSGE